MACFPYDKINWFYLQKNLIMLTHLLKRWWSTFILRIENVITNNFSFQLSNGTYLVFARKWSGRRSPGTIRFDNSLIVWFTPHMRTLSIGSLARNNFTFWCLTRKCFFLRIRAGVDMVTVAVKYLGTLKFLFAKKKTKLAFNSISKHLSLSITVLLRRRKINFSKQSFGWYLLT